MRLWSLHPKYLDPRGLVALWREALLAQAVLAGATSGYRHHPQLTRWREAEFPSASIAAYLRAVHEESVRRGYSFDAAKVGSAAGAQRIAVPRGQVDYEWEHLRAKLALRAPEWLERLGAVSRVEAHPLFHVVPGVVAPWEAVRGSNRTGPMS